VINLERAETKELDRMLKAYRDSAIESARKVLKILESERELTSDETYVVSKSVKEAEEVLVKGGC
jgi:hypothetical protein